MRHGLFFQVINMSITGGLVILAVLAFRLLLRRAPKVISYGLWSVVLFRLLCPFSFSLPFSLLGTAGSPAVEEGVVRYIPEDALYGKAPEADLQAPDVQVSGVKTGVQVSGIQTPEAGNNDKEGTLSRNADGRAWDVAEIGTAVWVGGVLLMLTYAVGMLVVLLGRLRGARVVESEELRAAGAASQLPANVAVYEKRGLPTPFVLGVFRPKVYLPAGMGRAELQYILLHEGIHIRRGDHVVKIVSFVALCIHWFNPLVWAAFFLSSRDMEMSCDEAVLRRLGNGVKKDYSASLLNLAAGRKVLGGMPLAFAEGDTGSRIRNVLKWRKPRRILICAGSAAALAAAVFLLANPMGSARADAGKEPGKEDVSGQAPDGQKESDRTSDDQTGKDQTPDGRAGNDSAGQDTAEQIAAYQAMDRGEGFTWETLKELMAEDTPLLESYAGYDRAMWESPEDPYALNAYLRYSLWDEEREVGCRLMVSYWLEDNHVDMIYLLRMSDQGILSLYDNGKWRDVDLEKFISHVPTLSDWLEAYTLPKMDQLSAGPFSANVGSYGGQTFHWNGGTGTETQERSGEFAPDEWKSAAAIYRGDSQCLSFEDGVLSDSWLFQNHSALEVLEPIEDCEEQALLCRFECDLFTLPEIDEAKENGILLSDEELLGKFWYVCFGREGSEYSYVMMLNQKYFTKEEAIAAAQSVRFQESAW